MVQTDKVREEFAQRLALASKEAGLDDHGRGSAIARALKISSKGVSKWFNGESIPRPAKMQELAKFLKVDPVWLQLGINPNGDSNVSYVGKKKTTNEFPLISWVSAGGWLEAVEPYRKDEIDVWPETTVDASESSFWLRVKGDSMTSPTGFTVPEGMIILVDPEKEAVSGKLVVAKLENENEATFKQYMTDAGRKYLKALNPHHPPTIINGNCKIIGVVVDIKWEHIP
ncbi:TPA: LexA family transcriptional regulator [Yersinia enterocolitica]|nr:LexA family transcriptional regulator [Yersinia enterocolitica]